MTEPKIDGAARGEDESKQQHHVSDTEATAVLHYATSVLATLRMPKWTVLIMEDPCDEDALASVTPVDGRYSAQLYLSKDWEELSNDARRICVTHEILHLMHRNVSTVVLDDTVDLMHDWEHDRWARTVRREFELMVDHLAHFLGETHNLIEAWDEAQRKARTPEGGAGTPSPGA